MSVELQSQPRPSKQHGKAEDEEPDGFARYRPLHPEPQPAHREYGDADRLEHGALLVLPPAAHAGPNGRENACQPGEAAENAIEKSDPCISRRAGAGHGLYRWPREA